jgi:hypothetical protein
MRFKLLKCSAVAVAAVCLMPSANRAEVIDLEDGHQCCRAPHPEALVIPADQFVGESSAAYAAAKQMPDICCKLFCYCGCDQVDGHSSLLECFISDHSVGCLICRREVLLALQLKKQKKTIGEIQRAVDQQFEKDYPFKNASKALKDYRTRRQYK